MRTESDPSFDPQESPEAVVPRTEDLKITPLKPFDATPEEEPLPAESVMPKLKEMIQRGDKVAIVTDLDGTVLLGHIDPMSVKMDEVAQNSLVRLHNSGVTVIAATGRAGAEAAKLMKVPGAYIIGTGGWELFETDQDDSTKGRSIIDERLVANHEDITFLLASVRQDFQAFIHAQDSQSGDALTFPVKTQYGQMTFEKKGVNDDFPEGIGHGYNFARIENLETRERLAQLIKKLYDYYFPESLKPFYEIDISANNQNVAVEIRPLHQKGKARSLIQILRKKTDTNPFTGENKRSGLYGDIPDGFDTLLFFGDTDGDSAASRAAHLVASFTKIEATGVAVLRPEEKMRNQERLARYSDVGVSSIRENGELLSALADVAEEKFQHNPSGESPR